MKLFVNAVFNNFANISFHFALVLGFPSFPFSLGFCGRQQRDARFVWQEVEWGGFGKWKK